MFADIASDAPPLAAHEIHVWTVPNRGGAELAASLLPCLSPHERQRASRMDDAQAFVIGRAGVRTILARYLRLRAGDLEIHAGTGGRPRVAGAPEAFDFSFSRCALLHVCAVTLSRRVGVDVAVLPDAAPEGAEDVMRHVRRDAWAKALGVGSADGPIAIGDGGGVHIESFTPGPGTTGAVAGDGRWALRPFTAQLAETGGGVR